MTAAPTQPGTWRQVTPPRSAWAAFWCGWWGHIETDQPLHIHGIPDQQWCRRCEAVWTRDGCVARECVEQSPDV